jgi:hypothetical protein
MGESEAQVIMDALKVNRTITQLDLEGLHKYMI